MQWYDYMRLVTVVLMIVALYGSGQRAMRLWSTYAQRLKELWWVFNAGLLFIAEGSIEAIIQDIGWGPRVLLYFMLSLAAVRAVFRNGGYIKGEGNG